MSTIYPLAIDLDTFAGDRALTLVEACQQILRGRGGRRLHAEVARRWITRGCRPAGDDGPLLYLPALLWCGAWHTMPEWCRLFEEKRRELGHRQTVVRQQHSAAVGAELKRIANAGVRP